MSDIPPIQPPDPYKPPQHPTLASSNSFEGDGTGGVIPYKNGPALISYYLGVFSLIPCLGLPLGLGAIVLGILGLRKARREPHVSGTAHAMVGLILGGITTLLWIGLPILFLGALRF